VKPAGEDQSVDPLRTPGLVRRTAARSDAYLPTNEHAARRRELTVRLMALVTGIVGPPALTAIGFATGHPLVAVGSLASAAPIAVAKLIRPPES
jgi:hypothetical protein